MRRDRPRGNCLQVDDSRELLLPAKPNVRVARGIRWYARRLVRKRFHAVRIDPGGKAIEIRGDGQAAEMPERSSL